MAYPKEGELVLATITKIQAHSVFCNLDEYNKSAMIHISEIAPGRIRNITDYLKEGKNVVAKILKVDEDRGHVDLSIRRVTASQRKFKASEVKNTKIVDNILEMAANELKKDVAEFSKMVREVIEKKYGSPYDGFQAVVDDDLSLEALGLDKNSTSVLEKTIKERIKEKSVSIKGEFKIASYEPDGVLKIREALKKPADNVIISYLGGGRYGVTINTKDYKEAEGQLQSLVAQVEDVVGEESVVFKRTDR